MNENENENKQEDVSELNAEKFAELLDEAKKNSVQKSEYEKILKERNLLAERLAHGEYDEEPKEKEPEIKTGDLRKDLFSNEMTNRDFLLKAQELRRRELERTGVDIWNPKDTADGRIEVEKLNDIINLCEEQSGGDPEVFRSLFNSHIADDKSARMRR